MNQALAALRADRAALLKICGGLAAADWQAPSGCEGWTIQVRRSPRGPVLGGCRYSKLPPTEGMPTEQAQELMVRSPPGTDGRGGARGLCRGQ